MGGSRAVSTTMCGSRRACAHRQPKRSNLGRGASTLRRMRALVLALSLTAATPALAQDMGEDAGAEDMGMGDLGVEDQGVDAGQDQGVDAGPTSAEEVEFFLAKGGGCAAGGAPGLLAALAFVGLAIRRRR